MASPDWTTLRDPQRPTQLERSMGNRARGHGTSHSIGRTQAELALGSWGQDRTNMKTPFRAWGSGALCALRRGQTGVGPLLNRTNSRLPIPCTSAEFLDITFQDTSNALRRGHGGVWETWRSYPPRGQEVDHECHGCGARLLAHFGLACARARRAGNPASVALAQGEVNIYSYREPQLIDPLLKAFADKTGIKTNIVYASAGLNERLAAEGQNSPADLLFTVDAGRLSEAKDAGLTQALESSVLQAAIPAQLRDPDGHWFGLTMRARIIYASKERVAQDAISYEDLADPKWKGKVCMRSGQHVYNTSLIATMIAHSGEEATQAWLRGVKANLAQKPAGGDREQARDIYSGKCDIALGNTYYMALLAKNEKNP